MASVTATDTTRYASKWGTIKEEVDLIDIDDEDEQHEEVDDEPYYGEGLFAFDVDDEEDEVPEHDPLSTDYDSCFEIAVDEKSDEKPQDLPSNEEIETVDLTEDADTDEIFQSTGNQQTSLIITAVASLQAEQVAGSTRPIVASFRSLDIFRCFLCRLDFDSFDAFLAHRTGSGIHSKTPYDAEREKAFCCGICQKPWNQPRKALACAIYGHDSRKIHEAMFIHSCPLCPDTHFAFHSLAAVGRHWVADHPDKPRPSFLTTCSSKDQLPTIKVGQYEINSVTANMIWGKPELVLENFPASESDNNVNSNNKLLKVYRCIRCKKNFETRKEVEIHICPVKTSPGPIPTLRRFVCEDCGREFPCSRNLRFHLLRTGACKKNDGVKTEELLYKCIICSSQYNTFHAFMRHRMQAHAEVPYEASLELPYACKICEKPAFIKREAMICALFGHDPTGLRKAMFKYKCNQCTTFGFHSTFALKRHWELEHPSHPLPVYLQCVTTDKPLPVVTITLEQLLSFKRLQNVGKTLVIERTARQSSKKVLSQKPPCPSTVVYDEVSVSRNIGDKNNQPTQPGPSEHIVEVAYIPSKPIESSEATEKFPIEEFIENQTCLICNKSFKDVRRHFKIHDQSRYIGNPKHKCVCGKAYHLRNSLHSHWKKNKDCKLKWKLENAKGDNQTKQINSDPASQEYVLRIPSPTRSSSECSSIKIEPPELHVIFTDETSENQNLDSANKEIDLYSAYAKLDEETDMLDLRNFIHLEVEEVPDNSASDADTEPLTEEGDGIGNARIEPKKRKVDLCVICNIEFPSHVMFMEHMENQHKDEYPYSCGKCGKPFKFKEQREKHEEIYHPIQYSEEPKLKRRDQCDQRYHVKASPDSHLKIKQFRCIKPKPITSSEEEQLEVKSLKMNSVNTSVFASSLIKRFSCTKCPRSFTKPYLLEQHNLLHTVEKPDKCSESKQAENQIYEFLRFKCCICGQDDFTSANDLHRHRLNQHKEIPYDREREKAFGCGVCHKPYLIKNQAMACAILGHDPQQLREDMFKYKCPECPKERLGYHDFNSIRKHWIQEHPNKTIPGIYLSSNKTADTLPRITINKEKAAEIIAKGPTEVYDFPLVVEFDLLRPLTETKVTDFLEELEIETETKEIDFPEELEIEDETNVTDFCKELETEIMSDFMDEELFLSTEITLNDALEAVKAVASIPPSRKSEQRTRKRHLVPSPDKKSKQPKRKRKKKKENLRDLLADDRALGDKRIARVLEKIRTARANKSVNRVSLK